MPRLNSRFLLLVITLCAPIALAQAAAEQRANPVALTLRDAVTRALENSRDIEVERLKVQMNEFDVKAAHGAYDPTFSSSLSFERRNTPVASILAGGENGKLKTNDFSGQAQLARKVPWQGGSMRVTFDQSRATTQNQFYALNPRQVYLRGFIPEGEIGRVRTGQTARVYLDSNPTQPLEATVSRIDPQASFTPENTYFCDDRVKQVVGVKLQLTKPEGFAKPGMPADGEVLVAGKAWTTTARK